MERRQERIEESIMANKKPKPGVDLWGKLQPEISRMRKEPTDCEALLWERLRDRQLGGYKFRRQYAIDRFIVDFCCPKEWLVVEVDGPIHELQVAEDKERDEVLRGFGYRVIRFSNDRITETIEIVLAEILHTLENHDWRSKLRPIIKGTPSPFSPDRGENGEGGWR
jgi:very-short-patch-repair endonuclease